MKRKAFFELHLAIAEENQQNIEEVCAAIREDVPCFLGTTSEDLEAFCNFAPASYVWSVVSDWTVNGFECSEDVHRAAKAAEVALFEENPCAIWGC